MLRVELLPLFCGIAALFISLVPSFDQNTRTRLSLVFQISWLGLIVFLRFEHLLSNIQLCLLLVQTLVLIGIPFQPVFWLLSGLSTAAILSTDLSVFLIFAYLHITFLLLVILQTGGLYKGSASYQSILFFLSLDLSAFFALSLSHEWAYWILILPGLARVLFLLTAPFARSLFVNCPTDIMLLMLGGSVPVGIAWLLLLSRVCPEIEFLETVCLGSCLFAVALFLIEKSRRQKAIYLLMSQTALCVNLILGSESIKYQLFGSLLCLSALLNSAIWIYFLEFPKVRVFNIAVAAFTLFLLVYKP
ncbi:MAG: hypothetical protein WCK42_03200 [Myxococcaceae bacterium]